MTDEIYDYFGGSSPRKMEPLDESEMFEDLLPSRKPELVEEPSPADVVVNDDMKSVAEQSTVDAMTSQSEDDIPDDAVDRSAPVKSHWDDLASSLGLSPPSAPPSASPSASPSAIEPGKTSKPAATERNRDKPQRIKEKTELEKKRVPKSGDRTRPTDDKFVVSPTAVQQSGESDADSFSEMFFSPEEIDFESVSSGIDAQPDDGFENDPSDQFDPFDPFAAFSGSQASRRKEPEIEIEESQPEILDLDEPVNKDFIEFEVQDIGGQRGDERETRARRGQRRPDRTEKRSGSEQVRKPSVERETEAVDDSRRETTAGRQRQRTESKRREPDRNEPRRDRHRSGGRADGSRAEGSRAEGSRAEGSRAEGSRAEGSRAEGSRAEESRAEGSRAEGSRAEGSRGRRSERNRTQTDNLGRDPASRNQNSADRSALKSERHREDSDDESEDAIGIKKAKIPTWEDAIGGVVEQNIKRHQSSSKGGGKRRRN